MATDPGSFTVDAMLADGASTVEGKLYVLGGGWNLLTASSFPFTQPRITLAAIVGVPYTATNTPHELEFVLLNEDGRYVGPDGSLLAPGVDTPRVGGVAQFTVGRSPQIHTGDRQNLPFAVNIDGVTFQSSGIYSFVFAIDKTEINRMEFRVVGPSAIIPPGP